MAKRTFAVTVPAETCSLKTMRAFFASMLGELGVDEAEPIVLALDEACSNVIKYRCHTISDGAIRVRAEADLPLIRFKIGRFCKPQDVDKIKPRDLEDVRPGGLGTSFISQIMDRVEFLPDDEAPDCIALLLEKRIETKPSHEH